MCFMTPEKGQTLSHNVVSCTPLPSGIHTEWIGSYKSNYHTITAMTITPIGSVSYRVWYCFVDHCLSFVLFLSAIVLSVRLIL